MSLLTVKEREILSLVSEGLTNSEIADELGVSVNTVKTHVAHILEKLAVSSRREAARTTRAG